MSSNVQTKTIVGTAIATSAFVAGVLAYAYKTLTADAQPKKWKRVGKVIDLNLFPIKSCAPIKKDTFDCGSLGLQDGIIQDRVFMIVTLEGQFVSARAHPKLVLIQPKLDGNHLTLSAPERSSIVIDIDELKKEPLVNAFVWQQEVDAIDAGDEVAAWVSDFILGTNEGLRIVFYPLPEPTRNVRTKFRKFPKILMSDASALADATGYMLINQASIDDLNTRIDHVVEPLQFRPNIIVEGPKAYEEDTWNWVRIGDNVVFRNIKPCTRCIFTNIDPVTGERNPNHQPLNTLKNYRNILPNESPVMGIHIGLREAGHISIGDAIYIEDNA